MGTNINIYPTTCMTSTSDTSVTMTPKDWEMIQRAYELKDALLKTISEVKIVKGDRKKKLTEHAHDYSKFLKLNERALARCFGGEDVVQAMIDELREIAEQRLGLKLLAA